jgi:transposase-like protein
MKIGECPRCDGKETLVIGKSPKKGVWELYRCENCQYIWRSTETKEMLTTMKLTEKEIREIPTVPKLRA